jgi:hypothetical protein
MICRHAKNDPTCSSYIDSHGNRPNDPTYYPTDAPTVYSANKKKKSDADRSNDPDSPDSYRFEIEDLEAVGPHLVVKVRYPNCSSCSYEGQKVLVYFNTGYKQVAMWKKIDPHFRDPKKSTANAKHAPSPDARFPASAEGWKNALAFARMSGTK